MTFLPVEGQSIISRLRQDAHEPLSILAGIHWIAHHPDVHARLSKLIVVELNRILANLNSSNYSTVQIKSMAALTLTPDKCYEECFGNWEDYSYIQSLVPLLEMKSGRPIMLRPKPETHIFTPTLWQRLQGDSFYRKITKPYNAN